MALSLETFEAQASSCLQEAANLRPQLLRYAQKLTSGDDEQARELVQEVTLAMHDVVQRKGFAGGSIKAYLFVAMRNRHKIESQRVRARLAIDWRADADSESSNSDCYEHPVLQQLQQDRISDEVDAACSAALCAAATTALQANFGLADRVLFRLSAEGFSSRDIETLTGRAKSSVARTLDKMRSQLQQLLRPLLGEA